jgi:hypothetical protein
MGYWVQFLSITKLASYEALPLSPILRYSSLRVSYACLATLRVGFF